MKPPKLSKHYIVQPNIGLSRILPHNIISVSKIYCDQPNIDISKFNKDQLDLYVQFHFTIVNDNQDCSF